MKKIFVVALVLSILTLGVSACGSKGGEEVEDNDAMVTLLCGEENITVPLDEAIDAYDICTTINGGSPSSQSPESSSGENADGDCYTLPIRSADVTDNFSGYVEYQAEGWIVPSCTMQDGIVSNVGSALITWCETQNVCTWWTANIGDPIPHEGEVNLYAPGFETHANELQYVNPDATWTVGK